MRVVCVIDIGIDQPRIVSADIFITDPPVIGRIRFVFSMDNWLGRGTSPPKIKCKILKELPLLYKIWSNWVAWWSTYPQKMCSWPVYSELTKCPLFKWPQKTPSPLMQRDMRKAGNSSTCYTWIVPTFVVQDLCVLKPEITLCLVQFVLEMDSASWQL